VIKLSTMTRIIQRMQAEGLVTCSTRPTDARVTEVRLTEAGKVATERVRGPASLIFRQAFRDISDKEMLAFIDVLQRLFDNLDGPP